MKHQINKLGDEWEKVTQIVAAANDLKSKKTLSVTVRFDGYGNAVVRFVVSGSVTELEYEKFDAAADAYNRLP